MHMALPGFEDGPWFIIIGMILPARPRHPLWMPDGLAEVVAGGIRSQ